MTLKLDLLGERSLPWGNPELPAAPGPQTFRVPLFFNPVHTRGKKTLRTYMEKSHMERRYFLTKDKCDTLTCATAWGRTHWVQKPFLVSIMPLPFLCLEISPFSLLCLTVSG